MNRLGRGGGGACGCETSEREVSKFTALPIY